MSTELLAVQLGYNLYTLTKNTEGVSQEESLAQPHPGGNCLNWVVGHLVSSRDATRRALGLEPLLAAGEEAVYARGAAPLTDPEKALPLARLVAAFAESQEPITGALAALTPEQLAAPAPFSPAKNPEETLATLLAGLLFHEAYHVGQTGVLRRLAGHPGVLT